MKVMKLLALALVAGLMMVGCDSKTEAPAAETTTTETVVEPTLTEDAEETETEVIADENETIN